MNQKQMFKNYKIINGSLAGIILAIFLYSAIYSPVQVNHPVPSIFEKITQQESPSTGLSRAFSEMIRGNFQKALLLNSNAYHIFAFFLIQLLLRIFLFFKVSCKSLKIKSVIVYDLTFSLLLFLFCFSDLIFFTLYLFFSILKNNLL